MYTESNFNRRWPLSRGATITNIENPSKKVTDFYVITNIKNPSKNVTDFYIIANIKNPSKKVTDFMLSPMFRMSDMGVEIG